MSVLGFFTHTDTRTSREENVKVSVVVVQEKKGRTVEKISTCFQAIDTHIRKTSFLLSVNTLVEKKWAQQVFRPHHSLTSTFSSFSRQVYRSTQGDMEREARRLRILSN